MIPTRYQFRRQLVTLRRRVRASLLWVEAKVPPGLRTILGLLLLTGGVFGALPILGFWMLPLGVAVIALDVRAFLNFIRRSRGGD